MQISTTSSGIAEFVRTARAAGRSVGLVLTMGAFHEGHLTLMRRARAECDVVIVSLFVNPTQFGPDEDLARYPRQPDVDAELARGIPVEMLFSPPIEEIYSPGSDTVVDVPGLATRWEGAHRPGHFRGVATVCAKLFNIVRADRAYFGQKDYQQLCIVRRMVTDLHLGVDIVAVPTVRDPDGLALSSRNSYLDARQREAALCLNRALHAAAVLFRSGDRSGPSLERAMRIVTDSEPLFELQYATVVDASTLEPLETLDRPAVALIAGLVGATHLIDNLPLLVD